MQNPIYEKIITAFNKKNYENVIAEYNSLKDKNLVSAFVLNLVGITYANKNQHKDAIRFISQAINLDPNFPDPYNNIGIIYYSKEKFSLAKENFLKCLNIDKNHFQATYGLANTYRSINEYDLAIQYYEKSIILNKNFYPAWIQKIRTQSQICKWDENINDFEYLCANLNNHSFDPYLALFMVDDPKLQFKITKLYVEKKYENTHSNSYIYHKTKSKKIKIGYLSSDYRIHATMHLIKNMLVKHDQDKFEIYCYSYGKKKDRLTKQMNTNIKNFEDISEKSDQELINYLREQKIDIAVDLKGFCSENKFFLFANRIAPIQVSYLGYPGTTGSNFIDYIIADKVVINNSNKEFFSEKIIFMPDSYQVNDDTRKISPKKLSRKDYDLPDSNFVFCCFNKMGKIHKREFDTWLSILKNTENSVLWLLSENKIARGNLKKYAESNGLDPKRIIFCGKEKLDLHLARHKLADLFLDTFIYNGHTTTSDSLWAGLPVITMSGHSFPSRVAGSLLKAIGLEKLITYNIEDYKNLAIELSKNKNKIDKIRKQLNTNRFTKPLFSTNKFTRNIEKAYCEIYKRFVNNQIIEDIVIK